MKGHGFAFFGSLIDTLSKISPTTSLHNGGSTAPALRRVKPLAGRPAGLDAVVIRCSTRRSDLGGSSAMQIISTVAIHAPVKFMAAVAGPESSVHDFGGSPGPFHYSPGRDARIAANGAA